MTRTGLLRSFGLISCLGLGGCSLMLSPLAKQSAAFGDAASVVIQNSSNAYGTVERVTYNASVSSLVLDFDKSGFDRNKIKPFLPAEDMQIRQNILRGLQTYADNLAEVAGDRPFNSLDQQSSALSSALVGLSENGELQKLATGANADEARGLATAVDTLAKVLVESRRRRELPGIISKMQPVLERLCGLLDRDLGNKPTNGKGGSGMRDQLWNMYDELIDNQTDYIAKNGDRLSLAEKAAEISKLPKLVAEQQSADAALASTQMGLRDLVKTHRALLMPEQSNTFRDRFNKLVQDGQQIGKFYSSLDAK
jgi:hypothetical protein